MNSIYKLLFNMKNDKRIKYWQGFINSISDSNSTQESKYQPRENILQAKGKNYELNKQRMKTELEAQGKLLTPFRPLINSKYESGQK